MKIRWWHCCGVLVLVAGLSTWAAGQMRLEFSLDIGSDSELSDPQKNGNEWFDPGDVYETNQAMSGPANGFKDDRMIFGVDPNPDPGDVSTVVPIGMGDPDLYQLYFDLDGHDQLDIELWEDLVEAPRQIPSTDLPRSLCLLIPDTLIVSYDDDGAPGWCMPLPGDVPVYVGPTHGMTVAQDELLAVPYPPMTLPSPYADEVSVHQRLSPNPDTGDPGDDDVDSLDLLENDCPFWYFTADHEAHMGLDPGDIYLANPTGISGPLLVVDDVRNLGLLDSTDVDAFEFIWAPGPENQWFLAVLFSVDQDDPYTANADESGGLDPRAIYISFLDGTHQQVGEQLEEDVDALTVKGTILEEDAEDELGDAPDSSNNFGVSMTAYVATAVTANYPTVYLTGSPPYGPIHWQPQAVVFLGNAVSLENEADIGPDQDGLNNLDPPNDAADQDDKDDGVVFPIALPDCQPTTFDYILNVVVGPPASLYVNAWFDYNRDGDWDDILTCPDGTQVSEWAVQNHAPVVSGPGVFQITTPQFVAYNPSTAMPPELWMRITVSEQPWTGNPGVVGYGGAGPAGGYQIGETEDYLFEPEAPLREWVFEFSLDIGSDSELSDPQADGDEWFDPGDVYYSWQTICQPTNGFKDDATIFGGVDPRPVPGVAGSEVPVGTGGPALYPTFFDLDGHDQLDFDLRQFVIDPPIYADSLPPSQCLHEPWVLYWSYDDDDAPGWPANDVPVAVQSPIGMTYGTTGQADEIIGALVQPMVPSALAGPMTGVANELMVNFSLWPNPDLTEKDDDDVDSLDAVMGEDVCPYWYFTVDHEANFQLDPGDIYLVLGPLGGPVPVIDNNQLGVPDGTDVDAFEFTVLPIPGGPMAFAVLFSVDNDDPLTPANESGGFNPNDVYVSFLTGGPPLLFLPLQDDVDALTILPKEPVKAPNLQITDVNIEPPPNRTLAKTKNNVIWLVFDESLAVAGAPPATFAQLLASSCESLGSDLSPNFTFSLLTTYVANDTLKIKENGPVLANQTWYRVKPTANLVNAAMTVPANNFVYDVCTLIGDANADCRVMAVDLGVIWSHNGQITEKRWDINGDGRVMAVDLGVAWGHNGQICPPKP